MAAPASAPRLSLDPGWPRPGPHPAPSLAWCWVQPLHRTPCVVWHTPQHTSHTTHCTSHNTPQHAGHGVCVGLEGEGGVSTPSPYQGQPSLAGPSPAQPCPAQHHTAVRLSHQYYAHTATSQHMTTRDGIIWQYQSSPVLSHLVLTDKMSPNLSAPFTFCPLI